MQFIMIFRILGMLLMIFSLSMLPPALIALAYQDSDSIPFFIAFILTAMTGSSLWLACRRAKKELKKPRWLSRGGAFLVRFVFFCSTSINDCRLPP